MPTLNIKLSGLTPASISNLVRQ